MPSKSQAADARRRHLRKPPSHIKKTGSKENKDFSELKDQIKKAFIVSLPIALGVAYTLMIFRENQLKERVRTPCDEAPVVKRDAAGVAIDQDMDRYWGSYRSNLYFGMKTRHPKSPVMGKPKKHFACLCKVDLYMYICFNICAGLMWLPQFSMDKSVPSVRHWCDQGDKLPMYGWMLHDGVNFGVQNIYDSFYLLTTAFIKRPGGPHGGDWSARITAEARVKTKKRKREPIQFPINSIFIFFIAAWCRKSSRFTILLRGFGWRRFSSGRREERQAAFHHRSS